VRIEVFTHGSVPEDLTTRYLAAVRSATLFASRKFGHMPLAVIQLRLYETEEMFA
jgi:hypothetical protein